MRPAGSGSAKSGASSEASAALRSCALSLSTQTCPRSLRTAGRPRCRHSAARLIRPASTNSRSRPAGTGTQTGPRQRPSGFATQPVALSASRAGHQSAAVEASASARACSPDSVSRVTMGASSRANLTVPGLTARRRPRQYRARCLAPSPTCRAPADRLVSSRARRQGLLALAIVVAAWGLTWPVNKVVLATLSPLWAVALRSAIATIALFALTASRGRIGWPPRQDLPVLLSITLLHMVGFNLLTSWGLGLVPTGRTVVLAYTTPLWVTPGAVLFLREPITARRAVGVLMGLAGLVTLFNPLALDWSDRDVVRGNLAILAG